MRHRFRVSPRSGRPLEIWPRLPVIGQFAQAIVAREMENNRFEIRTNAPLVKSPDRSPACGKMPSRKSTRW
jgi:hypothetical protein